MSHSLYMCYVYMQYPQRNITSCILLLFYGVNFLKIYSILQYKIWVMPTKIEIHKCFQIFSNSICIGPALVKTLKLYRTFQYSYVGNQIFYCQNRWQQQNKQFFKNLSSCHWHFSGLSVDIIIKWWNYCLPLFRRPMYRF